MKSLSRVRLLATPWTAAYQAPPSMGFSRQEYWSGVPLPSPRHKAAICKPRRQLPPETSRIGTSLSDSNPRTVREYTAIVEATWPVVFCCGSPPGLTQCQCQLTLEDGFLLTGDVKGFPGGSDSKESTCNAGDLGSIPGLGRSPGGGHDPTHSSILAWRIPRDRGAW